MKVGCGLLLVLMYTAHAAAQMQTAPLLSVSEYKQQLAQTRAQVAGLEANPESAPALEAGLPKSWKVQTAHGGEIQVSTDFARAGIESFLKAAPKEKNLRRKELEDSLLVLQTQAEAYNSAAPVDASLHPRLEQILKAREFRGLNGPSPLQLLWQRIRAWLQTFLEKLFPRLPSATESGPVFAWVVIALVCSALGVWIYRKSRETAVELTREVIPFAPGAKGWRHWLAEARASAGRGEWRDAIHLAFWAGVSKLEADSTWIPDRARTPREYLRAIPEWNASRPAFQRVMRSFESCWYGGHTASDNEFQEVLAALERMGCR
jgi:hypothetical protein